MPDWYKNRIFIPFLILLLNISIVLSISPFIDPPSSTPFTEGLIIDYPLFSYHKALNYFELIVHVYNISTGFSMNNASTSCEGHLFNASGEEVMHVPTATIRGNRTEEFIFPTTDITNLHTGYYGWSIHCNTSYLGGYGSGNFILSETGMEEEIIPQDTEEELLLYFVFALSIILLIVAFYKDDHNLAAISGMLQMILGGYILIEGFSTLTNALSNAIGIIFIAIGFYIFLRSSMENM